ncbi:MAG: hypothetical protein IIC69_03590 [Nanoarchaeota archaeon]|nr:hypothetical protein [Nanoarchaeota archaeon]
MKKLKIAVVIPTHFDIHSSLNNLLKAYMYLMKNNAYKEKIAKKGRQYIIKKFSIENIAEIFYNILGKR